MKRAFTMIELIFVIVIIGILASIAIPKLSATRDDAKLVTEITNIKQCTQDILGSYLATGIENNDSAACNSFSCAKIDLNNTYDGKINVKLLDSSDTGLKYCDLVKAKANKFHIENNYTFGGVLAKY